MRLCQFAARLVIGFLYDVIGIFEVLSIAGPSHVRASNWDGMGTEMTRASTHTFGFAALLSGAALSWSPTATAQTAKDLAGTWAWVSVETTRADGQKAQPFGPSPKGHVVFDGNGRFAYLLARPGRPKFGGNSREDGTTEENKAAVQGTLGMSGTCSVDGSTLTFKVEASTYPNSEGTEQKRTIISLTAEELRYSNPAPTNAGGGTAIVVAKRVK